MESIKCSNSNRTSNMSFLLASPRQESAANVYLTYLVTYVVPHGKSEAGDRIQQYGPKSREILESWSRFRRTLPRGLKQEDQHLVLRRAIVNCLKGCDQEYAENCLKELWSSTQNEWPHDELFSERHKIVNATRNHFKKEKNNEKARTAILQRSKTLINKPQTVSTIASRWRLNRSTSQRNVERPRPTVSTRSSPTTARSVMLGFENIDREAPGSQMPSSRSHVSRNSGPQPASNGASLSRPGERSTSASRTHRAKQMTFGDQLKADIGWQRQPR
jgi:hypothetical protein